VIRISGEERQGGARLQWGQKREAGEQKKGRGLLPLDEKRRARLPTGGRLQQSLQQLLQFSGIRENQRP